MLIGNLRVKEIIIPLILSGVFFVFIPLVELFPQGFVDYYNYIDQAERIYSGYNPFELSGFAVVFNEPLWWWLLKVNNDYLGFTPTGSVTFISFLSLSFYLIFIVRHLPYWLAFVILFNPMFIDLVISQIRIAFAFSLVLIALFSTSDKLKFVVAFLSIFIHTAMVVVLLFCAIVFIVNQLSKDKHYFLLCIVSSFLVALLLSKGLLFFLEFVGDRRAELYAENSMASSISYSVFWLLIALALVVLPLNNLELKYNRLFLGYTVFVCCLFFFGTIFDLYVQRYLAISLPFVFLSVYMLKGWYKVFVLNLILLYQMILLLYWFQIDLY